MCTRKTRVTLMALWVHQTAQWLRMHCSGRALQFASQHPRWRPTITYCSSRMIQYFWPLKAPAHTCTGSPPAPPFHPIHIDIIWKYIFLNLKFLGSPLKKKLMKWIPERPETCISNRKLPQRILGIIYAEEVLLHIATVWSPRSIHAHGIFRQQTQITGDLGVHKDRLGSLWLRCC